MKLSTYPQSIRKNNKHGSEITVNILKSFLSAYINCICLLNIPHYMRVFKCGMVINECGQSVANKISSYCFGIISVYLHLYYYI